MFDRDFGHWEICHVGRRERRANADSSGSDQTVRLVKSHTALSELTTPGPGSYAFSQVKGSKPQTIEEAAYRRFLRGAQSSPDLLN